MNPRRGQPPERRTFSVADAKRAKLWFKAGPWTTYPDRMLQMRARGFAIRDTFPDALRGVIIAEEAQDHPTEVREVPNLAVGPTALPPPQDWREMSWPARSRDGTCRDMEDPGTWEAEHAVRIRTIEQHPRLSADAKRNLIEAVLGANKEVLDHLRKRGHGAALEAVEGLFAEALGVGLEVAA
jgi:hypothetical protein